MDKSSAPVRRIGVIGVCLALAIALRSPIGASAGTLLSTPTPTFTPTETTGPATTPASTATTGPATTPTLIRTVAPATTPTLTGTVAPATTPAAHPTGVSYYGGPVLGAPTTYVVFWLPRGHTFEPGQGGGDARYERLITRYFRDIGGTPYYGILAEYSDDPAHHAPVTGGPIRNRSPFGGAYVDTTPYPWERGQRGAVDTDSVVANVVRAAGWRLAARNIVVVFTAAGVQRSAACAFHDFYTHGARTVVYAFVKDVWSLAGCRAGLRASGVARGPNSDIYADTAISAAAHEQFESVTDPLGASWHTTGANYAEIVDLCPTPGPLAPDGHNVTLHGRLYLVQEVWSNAAGRCVLSA